MLDDTRQHERAEVGLVDVHADSPGAALLCRLERTDAARAGDVEHDPGAARDLIDRGVRALCRIVEIVREGIERRDLRIGVLRPGRKPATYALTGGMGYPATLLTTCGGGRRSSIRAAR